MIRIPSLTSFFLMLCLLFSLPVMAQERIITAGFQFKPIFTSDFFDTGPIEGVENGVRYEVNQQSGVCFGMVVRKGITDRISFETGINVIKRNFDLGIEVLGTDTIQGESFSITGYELPLQGMVFIQLSDRIFMDVAMGVSLDFFPNDFRVFGDNFSSYSAKNSLVAPALIANVGWEYRTPKSGFFYLGASFHRPFDAIYYEYMFYPDDKVPSSDFFTEIQGNYLTADLRYFFPSDPERRKNRTRKPDRDQR